MTVAEDVWILFGVGVFVVVLFGLALLVPRRAAPGRSTDVKLDDVKTRLEEVERKQNQADHDLRNVRMTIAGLATKDSVNQVAVQVAEMRGEVRGLIDTTKAISNSVTLMQSFLMKAAADVIVSGRSDESK